ncbi:MAG TPA: 4-hydroxythreonine-4-phosphate dehydrogenase PdxA [Bacteroidales bacterium]|nr:4-hydroxythreonine-4-phosphate dehydrogenase PdxA [Bacteroidales bacterium]
MANTHIGISHGDINSISYEVIIKSLSDSRILELCIPIIYGSPKAAAYHKKAIEMEEINFTTIRNADEATNKRPNIINCINDDIRVELGKSTRQAGASSYAALKAAVNDLKNDNIEALVTGPINKQNIQSNEFQYSGHTEYLKDVFNVSEVLMLMVSQHMKVGVVAGHIPIAKLPTFITKDRILAKIRILNQSLQKDFNISKPKIAVLGLNPHAGDEGLLGNEEQEIIIPAMNEAKKHNTLVFGPYAADGFFGSGKFKKFDGILAMYHDQGLAPFKSISGDDGVNYTAGLPVVRTSPAHGTAYELAGKNEASHDSFRNAIYLACDIIKNRKYYDEVNANPLKSSYSGSGKDDDLPEEVETQD